MDPPFARRHLLAAVPAALGTLLGSALFPPPARAQAQGSPALPAAPACAAPAALCERIAMAGSDGSNTHGVLVQQGQRTLAETYFTGSDKPGGAWFARQVAFDVETLHDLRSISKSVVGLLVGIALERGLLGTPSAALQRPVFDFFPEHADLLTPERRALTLRHLLDMSTGWDWDETTRSYSHPLNSETRMAIAPDPLRHMLELPFVAEPGRRWEYCGGATLVLAEVLEKVGGRPLAELAHEWLFAPLGIARFEWRTSWRGKALSFSGLRLAPRDLARIGTLLLTQGRWEGRAVLPPAWVEDTLTPRQTGWDGFGYGAQWWHGPFQQGPGAGVRWVSGWGNGGQRLFVAPSLELVMVVTAGRYNEPNNGRPSNRLFREALVALRA